VHAAATGRSPLDAARAAGAVLGRTGLVRGAVAHALVSTFWAAVLARALPRRSSGWAGALDGAIAGAGIAVLDLGVVGRRLPAIRALPVIPQVVDHLAFGALVGAVLARRRRQTSRRAMLASPAAAMTSPSPR
jgi:hypothetical protein